MSDCTSHQPGVSTCRCTQCVLIALEWSSQKTSPCGGDGRAQMSDLWSMTLADVRVAFSEVIDVYLSLMRDKGARFDDRISTARLAQQALNDYLRLLSSTEIEVELRQMQTLLAGRRPEPRPYED
jgi:hypothetical protein